MSSYFTCDPRPELTPPRRIIVGVKYCFRYNARNRALRNGEDADHITLETMPARPHRRRREKKLMTMDEVNDRFPLCKYKNWVATRASEGLSTSGGVNLTAPPSRAPSVREVDAATPAPPNDGKSEAAPPANATDATSAANATTATTATTVEGPGEAADKRKSVETATGEKEPISPIVEHFGLKEVHTSDSNPDKHDDDDDDDEHIHTALAPELLANPGDSCAICIDTLEPDDDIRGLTCGHAFHAGCLDPWLTSRRACCPLCKADYYTPKPRPEGEPAEPERSGRRGRAPQPPPAAWTGLRGTRMVLPGRFIIASYPGDGVAYGPRESGRDARGRRTVSAMVLNEASNPAPAGHTEGSEPAATSRRWRPRISNPFRSFTMPGRSRAASVTAAPETAEPSPSQLEAGVHR